MDGSKGGEVTSLLGSGYCSGRFYFRWGGGGGGRCLYIMCVLHVVLIFLPIYIQHKQWPCRCLLLFFFFFLTSGGWGKITIIRETSSAVSVVTHSERQIYLTFQVQQGDLAME